MTQNNQAFTDNNQLQEIMKYAKVVVVMFDKKQIMNAEQYLDDEAIKKYIDVAKENDSFIELTIQMRMNVNKEVQNWFKELCENCKIEPLTCDRGEYEIKIFDSPQELEQAIKNKAYNKETSLSRIVASYDWPYSGVSVPENEQYWSVKIGTWNKPWNRELIRHSSREDVRKVRGLSWAEQPQTINEVGSIYTIQGFDLNYAGVILGPSIKYENGKIVFDASASCNNKATHKRTLSDGTCKSFAEEFLKHEIGVLLTRRVNGLYIYACDKDLRERLKECV